MKRIVQIEVYSDYSHTTDYFEIRLSGYEDYDIAKDFIKDIINYGYESYSDTEITEIHPNDDEWTVYTANLDGTIITAFINDISNESIVIEDNDLITEYLGLR